MRKTSSSRFHLLVNTPPAGESRRERGATVIVFACVMLVTMLVVATTVDLGSAFVARSMLSKAVDAGAIAGARYAHMSDDEIEQRVIKVADANYNQGTQGFPVQYDVTITYPSADTKTVRVGGDTVTKAYFSKLLGKTNVPVSVVAEATRFPLDMSLVLDLSASLERNNAFDDLQNASVEFINFFDDSVDQIGITTYSTWAQDAMALQKNFKVPGAGLINGLSALTDTNIEEGLRVSKGQLDVAPFRQQAMKVVVLFTDGRPTAFADQFTFDNQNNGCGDGTPQTYDGIVATYIEGPWYRGLFRDSDGRKIRYFYSNCSVNTTYNASSASSPKPLYLPGGGAVDGDNIRQLGADQSEAWANTIREAGYTVYTIGLGDPEPEYEGDNPDLDFLKRLANVGGLVNPNQPRGEMMFAPSPDELDDAFLELAGRLITRLTR